MKTTKTFSEFDKIVLVISKNLKEWLLTKTN